MHSNSAIVAAMNATLLDFEKRLGIGPVAAARVLGCAYPTYAQYRSGRRDLPTYHAYHIEVLLAENQRAKEQIIKERINGTG
jgi:DNA-binding transcriptional regulator YdaS (Cro superfamily)